MVRHIPCGCRPCTRSPHARGDGPSVPGPRAKLISFSPRPWGWSVPPLSLRMRQAVLPTPVGMVRTASSSTRATARSPHARGDGPPNAPSGEDLDKFSPRPWGWSVCSDARQPSRRVLPTPVGMVRACVRVTSARDGSPHARGDGPHFAEPFQPAVQFSPRPWGWSGHPSPARPSDRVLPTPVGMVRSKGAVGGRLFSSPHARGDGPPRGQGRNHRREFSPRPWGWSVNRSRLASRLEVLPTPVGMVRFKRAAPRGPSRSPHARGDGPSTAPARNDALKFSPRPWGWSGMAEVCKIHPDVLPTPVGMVRWRWSAGWTESGSPHARGDGPTVRLSGAALIAFSPRPWGWSGVTRLVPPGPQVLPTPVGMVRRMNYTPKRARRSPHARGDGPRHAPCSPWAAKFSPRPWGWSVYQTRQAPEMLVLPTPVGMVRGASVHRRSGGGSPHARGDGPGFSRGSHFWRKFSPRPWGWSIFVVRNQRRKSVLPTPVGMVRRTHSLHSLQARSPHARGDGPEADHHDPRRFVFSPRPWGWSGMTREEIAEKYVLPTPVGMVRL